MYPRDDDQRDLELRIEEQRKRYEATGLIIALTVLSAGVTVLVIIASNITGAWF